jgi:hypothetical protein
MEFSWVRDIAVDFEARTATVLADGAASRSATLIEALERAGFAGSTVTSSEGMR